MPHPGPPRRRQQMLGRLLVTAPGTARTVHHRPHPRERRVQFRPARAQIDAVRPGVPAEHPQLVPVRAQPLGDLPAERARAAGDQDRGHAVSAPWDRTPPVGTPLRREDRTAARKCDIAPVPDRWRPGGGQGPSSPPPGPIGTLKGLDHYGQWEGRGQPAPEGRELTVGVVVPVREDTDCERAHTDPLSARPPGVAHWPCTRSSALRGR
ncbi:hypothetical protein SRO_6035 [Streptomyces rochei]|nr:hypothetical protein SRO_6035 [Streptomyces rochei]